LPNLLLLLLVLVVLVVWLVVRVPQARRLLCHTHPQATAASNWHLLLLEPSSILRNSSSITALLLPHHRFLAIFCRTHPWALTPNCA
jgi:hypothetical protein